MRMTTALAAMLACAAASLAGTSVSAQQPAGSRTAAAPAVRVARAAPVYRVELVIFRATTALGGPEDWAAESGTAPAATTDADPGSSGEPARSESGQPEGAQSDGAAQGGASVNNSTSGAPPQGGASAGGAASNSARSGGAPSSSGPSNIAPPNIVSRLLPSSAFQLDSVASRLRASGRYVPVAHIAWEQTASPWGRPIQIPVQSIGLDAPGITGTVALERGQFLHLALDLRYAMNDPPAGLNAPPGTVFVLHQSHRVRPRERNYFDHPAFGVIALVTLDDSGRVPSR